MNITWLHTTRTIVGRTLALGLIVFAVACASETQLTTAPELLDAEGEFLLSADGYTLTGVITNAETGEPLAGVRVTVSQPGRRGFHATTTGADGSYEVVGLSGNIIVTASEDGFEGQSLAVDIDSDQVLDFDLSEETDDDEEDGRGL